MLFPSSDTRCHVLSILCVRVSSEIKTLSEFWINLASRRFSSQIRVWYKVTGCRILKGEWKYAWKFLYSNFFVCQSQWPRGLRRRSSAARLLRLWVRIPSGGWMFVCCEYCVLSGRSLCDGLISRPEEFYRQWRVVVCDQETSKTMRLKPATELWKYNHSGV